ncbi:ATP-binding protein [Roseixanthobacter glucoisosaccharinicivorans]|uniref:ATP-binding protein n=1 Tax=Roseixanthobacter glucoisosaccharinicivorans TaxID=3119923 RepID=UPI00372B21C6
MDNPRLVGHIVAVQGFRIKVELLPETRSALRATLDGVQVAIAINAYLTFSLGAGETVIGIITDLEARESFDPTSGDDLSLELMKPRRVASVQLLGTIERIDNEPSFSPGISVLPTLDTPAEIGSPEILRAVFEIPPRRNRPEDYDAKDFDCELKIGHPTGQSSNVVRASYNDLFSRPLAIVGNTGSGKSYSVSSLIQKAMKALDGAAQEPHIFILDINGEYERAFPSGRTTARQPDRVYLNGEEFGVPLWFLNAEEICAWLSASEQTQEPVLKDWWAIAKGGSADDAANLNSLQNAMSALDQLLSELTRIKKKAAGSYCDAAIGHLADTGIDTTAFEALFAHHRTANDYNTEVMNNQAAVATEAEKLKDEIRKQIIAGSGAAEAGVRTADSPLPIARATLTDPSLINRAVSKEDTFRVDAHLTTLKLRLKTRLDDKRWRAFLNYEEAAVAIADLSSWFARFGLGKATGPKVSVLDLSMLSNEVLPYACAVIGRILLEARERLPAASRYKHPWVLVLEEAHNYARPGRSDEDRGHRQARLTYERIAKEGRKFGLSLIIASQRPSEISQTIISQCANFISHRLQNPDDIDHFRRIIPMQARRLLDQVTILASGEAIVFGSAFHIPARVQFDRPDPGPYSQTAAPFHEWSKETKPFPLQQVITAWGVEKVEEDSTDEDF